MTINLIEEKEPGVYVRTERPEHDIDFLWDKDRNKKQGEQDRFHLGFFAGGVLVGVLITSAVVFVLFSGDKLMSPPVVEKPPIIEEQSLQPKASPRLAIEETQEAAPIAVQAQPAPKAEEKTTAITATAPQNRYYAVQSGDTLGRIAIKFYKSSDPANIAKIQKANNLSNADTLSIGQKLIIPAN